MGKRKQYGIIILQLFIFSMIYSQSTWEFYSRVDSTEAGNSCGYDEVAINFHRLDNGDILSLTDRYYGYYNQNNTRTVLRLHNGDTGEVYKEVVYSIDSVETLLRWAFYDDEKEIFTLVGSAQYVDVVNKYKRGHFLITRWDKDLNFLSDTIIDFMPPNLNYNLWYFSGNYTSDGNYLILCKFNKKFEQVGTNNIEVAILIDKEGNVVNRYGLKDMLSRGVHTAIFEDKKRDRYVLFGPLETTYLDKDFNYIDNEYSVGFSEYVNHNHGNARMINADTVLFTARINNYHRGVAYLSMSERKIKKLVELTTTKEPTIEISLGHRSLDYIDTSAIFMVSQRLDFGYSYYTVSKLNSRLDPYWIKYYSVDDTLRHVLWSMLATLDGGVIVGGAISIVKDGIVQRGGISWSWIKKFDGDGNSVATYDQAKDAWAITVYPNPSEGEFKINIEGDQVRDTRMEIYDIEGQAVKYVNNLQEGVNHLYLNDLPAGIYVWRLIKKGRVIGTGKWSKL